MISVADASTIHHILSMVLFLFCSIGFNLLDVMLGKKFKLGHCHKNYERNNKLGRSGVKKLT